MTDVSAPSGSRMPRWPLTLMAAALFLAAIWSVLWLFLSNRADGALQNWLVAEKSNGRQWTCPQRHLGGYPFAVALHCERPTFRGEVAGRTADGSVEAIDAGVRLDQPRRLRVDMHGPLLLRSEAEDFDLTVSWAALRVTIDNLGGRQTSGSFDATRLAVTLQTARQGAFNLRATTAAGEAHASPTAPGDAGFSLAAGSLTLPTLDALPGLEQPADLDARGTLVRADLLRAPTRALLDGWRTAGGALHLAALSIRKGPFRCSASGTLELDEAHRPAGTLQTATSGFEPIATRFGIPLPGIRLGGLLSDLLGGGKAGSEEPGDLRLPVTLDGGGVFIGPFKTGVHLEPLY